MEMVEHYSKIAVPRSNQGVGAGEEVVQEGY